MCRQSHARYTHTHTQTSLLKPDGGGRGDEEMYVVRHYACACSTSLLPDGVCGGDEEEIRRGGSCL